MSIDAREYVESLSDLIVRWRLSGLRRNPYRKQSGRGSTTFVFEDTDVSAGDLRWNGLMGHSEIRYSCGRETRQKLVWLVSDLTRPEAGVGEPFSLLFFSLSNGRSHTDFGGIPSVEDTKFWGKRQREIGFYCTAYVQLGINYKDYPARLRIGLIVQMWYFLRSSHPGRDKLSRVKIEDKIGFGCADMILPGKLISKSK